MSTDKKSLNSGTSAIGLSGGWFNITVANARGGVGKTTSATIIADLCQLAGVPLALMQIDKRRRLSAFMGDSSVTSIEPLSLKEARTKGNTSFQAYDPVADLMKRGNTLLDIGANEDRSYFDWAQYSQLDRICQKYRIAMDVVAVTLADPMAIEGATEVLRRAESALPSARRIVILNERNGNDFARLKGFSELDTLKQVAVRLPLADMEIWHRIDTEHLRVIDVASMTAEEMMAAWGLSESAANRAELDFLEWLEDVRTAFAPIYARG